MKAYCYDRFGAYTHTAEIEPETVSSDEQIYRLPKNSTEVERPMCRRDRGRCF
jgi:hypothetical protein